MGKATTSNAYFGLLFSAIIFTMNCVFVLYNARKNNLYFIIFYYILLYFIIFYYIVFYLILFDSI